MRAIWGQWVAALSVKESALTLAVFRVLVGIVALSSLLSVGAAGVVELVWFDRLQGGIWRLDRNHWIWTVASGFEPGRGLGSAELWPVYWVAIGGALCTTIGLGGRWSILVAQQTYTALASLNARTSGGYDGLISIALLMLFLGSSTQTLSADARIRHGTFLREARVHAWPRYALALQLLVMYSATGFQKIGLSWTPLGGYTALYYVLHDPTWTVYPPNWVAMMSPLLRGATALTWHWEQAALGMVVVLYVRATPERGGRLRAWLNHWDLRLPWAAVGVALHVSILALLNVGPFSWISLSYYVTLWSGDELERGLRILSRRTASA
jgi:hypothetical protein